MLYIYDPLSKTKFLVDTGAEISVLPATFSQKSLPPVAHLYAANGTKISVYKRQTIKLELNLRRSFEWTFYVAAILGADFLSDFSFSVDIKNVKILDSTTLLSIFVLVRPGESTHISVTKAEINSQRCSNLSLRSFNRTLQLSQSSTM